MTRERTSFIGRDRELELLVDDLERGHGLLTITGPSGIGKTRLARQVGRAVEAAFAGEGGVWFCNLAACTSPADVEGAVARMLEVPQAFGDDLGSALANRGRMLLILDNLDSAATRVGGLLESWLDRAPKLQLVTTSIVPIEVEGAIRYDLGPLEAGDAVALYLERAHRAWGGNTFEQGDRPTIEELVGRLDRIPLAIELAAARVRVLPPKALLSRFDDRFELLHSGKPGRHGSLLEALTLTWELLSEREQRLLARASVFEGGFRLEAAREILDPSATEVEMLDLLDGLRSKALLQLEGTDEPRFLLFESVRDFAARELRSAGLEADARRRHVEHFIERGGALIAKIEGSEGMKTLRWLQAERENLVAALLRNAEGDPANAARVGIVLAEQIKREDYLSAGIRLLEQAVEAGRQSGDRLLLLRSLARYCAGAISRGDSAQGAAALEEGLELARELGEREEEGNLLLLSGWRHLRAGDLELSAAAFDQAIAIGARENLPLLHAAALMNRGEAAHSRLAMEEAESYCAQALAILRKHDLPLREGRSLIWMAVIWASLGRFDEARDALETALDRSRTSGHRGFEASALMNLGGMELFAGRLDEAQARSLEALEIQREVGNRRGEGIVLGNLGNINLARGELADAEGQLRASVRIFKECGDRRFHAAVLPFLAVLEARLGQLDAARKHLDEARAYFLEVDDRASQRITEILEGSLELAEATLRTPSPEAQALARRAASRFKEARAEGDRLTAGMFEAIRLLEADLAAWNRGADGKLMTARTDGLVVGPEAGWFEVLGQERVDLHKRVAIRRMFGALVKKRLSAPGTGMTPHELFEVGWPDEEAQPGAALRRVYLGMWTLRDMGLADVLVNQSDGYLLSPDLPLQRIQA